ncbi:DUF3149 domain-containing protein [Pseudoalteromonas spongiae]
MSNLFRDFFQDPVIFLSFGILGVVIVLCLFYVGFFINKIKNDQPSES